MLDYSYMQKQENGLKEHRTYSYTNIACAHRLLNCNAEAPANINRHSATNNSIYRRRA